jgi:hypothetical protein
VTLWPSRVNRLTKYRVSFSWLSWLGVTHVAMESIGRLKIPQLVEALRGRVRTVHRFRLQQQLERIDFVDAQIGQLEDRKTECAL